MNRVTSMQRLQRRQDGQALTEFLVAAVALIPLLLLIPVIAKYQDMAHATQMASRYVAFEAMTRNDAVSTWKSEGELAAEVRRRFFSNSNAPIKTGDTAGNFLAHQNLFWRGPNGAALINNFDTDVAVSFGAGNNATHAGAFSAGSDGTPFVLRSEYDLQARGVYTVNVSVAVANLPTGLRHYQPFDQINLRIARSTSVVVDPWTSNSPTQTEARIANSPAVFPAGTLQGVAAGVNAAVAAIDLGRSGPQLGRLDFWRDVVPEDRLR